jgi:hypothetical protein
MLLLIAVLALTASVGGTELTKDKMVSGRVQLSYH